MIAVDPPCRAKASARHMTKVVLPTPPFVEQTLITDMDTLPVIKGQAPLCPIGRKAKWLMNP